MNREDCAAAVNHLSAALINVDRLYTAAVTPVVRADLAQIRQEIKGSLDRLRRLQQESTDGGGA